MTIPDAEAAAILRLRVKMLPDFEGQWMLTRDGAVVGELFPTFIAAMDVWYELHTPGCGLMVFEITPLEPCERAWLANYDAAEAEYASWIVRPLSRSQKLAAAGFIRRPSLWAMKAHNALELIAAPRRPDGTWNRDREACRQLAAEALGRYDDSETPSARVHAAP